MKRTAVASLVAILGVVGWPTNAGADTVLVEDDLTDAAACSTLCNDRSHLGANAYFQADGWHQDSAGARVIYDLGQSVECGLLELTLTNFDPTTQVAPNGGVDEYHPLMRLNEDPSGQRIDHSSNTIPEPSAVHIQVVRFDAQSLERHKRFRLSAWASGGFSGANSYTGKFSTWNPSHYYQARLEWSSAQVSLEVTDTSTSVTQSVTIPLVWPPGDPDPRLNLRYLFLGRDNCNSCGQTMTGPIWSDVRLTEYSQCPAPLVCDCPPDDVVEQSCGDCGTQTRSCGSDCFWAGSWSTCDGEIDEGCGGSGGSGGATGEGGGAGEAGGSSPMGGGGAGAGETQAVATDPGGLQGNGLCNCRHAGMPHDGLGAWLLVVALALGGRIRRAALFVRRAPASRG